MLYHVGALHRLNELGLLSVTGRFSSVSGGSIAAAVLGAAWRQLRFDESGVADNFVDLVQTPLFELAGRLLDVTSVLEGVGSLRGPAKALSRRYVRYLFGSATLQDLPDAPRFTLNTTNLATGTLMRWAKEYTADYKVGTIFEPTAALADVVAASSHVPAVSVTDEAPGQPATGGPWDPGAGGVATKATLAHRWRGLRQPWLAGGGELSHSLGERRGRSP